ncbi:hypothetical protein [Thermogemmata fonticola]|uniref:Uncharacterized protein n=1 Tax=Thermogemmata fonticola TaxID=2755323 RepID=A0A7V9ACW3_9BACT|nr:hypothetical protein [Thermogemmata fonticola]MBA2227393.1 hypothetical protein [Thermogemmata fonticola]
MRNLFALIGFAVVAFAVVGWYCGWYRLSVQKGEGGKAEIQTVVDTKKVTEDSSAFFQKLGQILSQQTQGTGGGSGSGTNPASDKGGSSPGGNSIPGSHVPGSTGLKPQNPPPGATPPPFSAPPVSIPPFSGKTP